MKDLVKHRVEQCVKYLHTTPEWIQLMRFLQGEAAKDKPEHELIIGMIVEGTKNAALRHWTNVRELAQK